MANLQFSGEEVEQLGLNPFCPAPKPMLLTTWTLTTWTPFSFRELLRPPAPPHAPIPAGSL